MAGIIQRILFRVAIVESKNLLIQIAVKVIGLDCHICAAQCALQQRTMRSREQIEASITEQRSHSEHSIKQSRKRGPGNPDKTIPFRWKKGQSGNPGGRPKRDLASELCQAVFENHPEEIYAGIRKLLKSGSAFGFQVAADRGFGKLKETMEVSGSVDLVERLKAGRKRVAEGK